MRSSQTEYECCGIRFPEALGKYGCPNCNGDKIAKLKEDHHMLQAQRHFFYDVDGNRTLVRTSRIAGGGYRAVVVESHLDYSPATGRGDTRMEAIADLNGKIWSEYLEQ
jgi:hypothetical protein